MDTRLTRFLRTTDLDDLLRARQQLGEVTETQRRHVLGVLRVWTPLQAVANVLFYPELIPPGDRARFVLRGLTDNTNPYNKLAATVGLQGLETQQLSDHDRRAITDLLLEFIEADQGVTAERASVAVWQFLSNEHVPQVVARLGCANETVSHNMLAWLVQTCPDGKEEVLRQAIVDGRIPAPTKEVVTRELDRYWQSRNSGQPTAASMPLYSYIPNLEEVQG